MNKGELELKTLRGFGDSMIWSESAKRSYELRAGGDVVATMQWPRGFSSPGTGETADGRVVLERSGLLRPRVVVREDAAPSPGKDSPAMSQRPPVLTLDVDFGGRGTARTQTDHKLSWVPQNVWRTAWAFEDGGNQLVTFEANSSLTQFGHKVKLGTISNDRAPLGALVLLGSAVGVLLTEDAAMFGI